MACYGVGGLPALVPGCDCSDVVCEELEQAYYGAEPAPEQSSGCDDVATYDGTAASEIRQAEWVEAVEK